MVSLEDGAYRLTGITESPPGKLKLIFDFGSIDHPIYGKCEQLRGEIPLLHTQESMPISNYYELTKEQQTKILNENIDKFRPILEDKDEADLYKSMLGGIFVATFSVPHVDVASPEFETAIAMTVMSLVIDDYTEDLENLESDPSATTRMIIDNFCPEWDTIRSCSEEQDEAFFQKLTALLPLPDVIKLWLLDFIKKARRQFPNGVLPDGFKYVIKHCHLGAGSVALRYRLHDPMPLSEDMQRVIRIYDVGFAPLVHAVHALRCDIPIPKKIRKSLLFKLLDTAAADFAGMLNDLMGIEKDIRKEATNENCILRSIVREGTSLEQAFNTALKQTRNLVFDIEILMRRLVEAFPEEQGLADFVNATREIMDGQMLNYATYAQCNLRYGGAKIKIVPA